MNYTTSIGCNPILFLWPTLKIGESQEKVRADSCDRPKCWEFSVWSVAAAIAWYVAASMSDCAITDHSFPLYLNLALWIRGWAYKNSQALQLIMWKDGSPVMLMIIWIYSGSLILFFSISAVLGQKGRFELHQHTIQVNGLCLCYRKGIVYSVLGTIVNPACFPLHTCPRTDLSCSSCLKLPGAGIEQESHCIRVVNSRGLLDCIFRWDSITCLQIQVAQLKLIWKCCATNPLLPSQKHQPFCNKKFGEGM